MGTTTQTTSTDPTLAEVHDLVVEHYAASHVGALPVAANTWGGYDYGRAGKHDPQVRTTIEDTVVTVYTFGCGGCSGSIAFSGGTASPGIIAAAASAFLA